MLIVFSGLPGTGKTTLARAVSDERRATYLRIDTIEQAIRASGNAGGGSRAERLHGRLRSGGDEPEPRTKRRGRLRHPLAVTRDAWRAVARRSGVALIDIEVICSDRAEHRRRVETRLTDIRGLKLPSREDVLGRDYEAWDRPRLVIDTSGRSVEDTLAGLRSRIAPSV